MELEVLNSPAWYHAVTLKERTSMVRPKEADGENEPFDAELARKKLERWKSQIPFSSDSYFAQRLEMDGLNEEQLLNFLTEPIEAVQQRFTEPPSWLVDLVRAFSCPSPAETLPLPEIGPGMETIGFLGIIEPVLHQARSRVREGLQSVIQDRKDLPFDHQTIVDVLFGNLPWKLVPVLSRTMILELNVARLEGKLAGETPEERFKSFLTHIRNSEVAFAILQEYPILARHLLIRIEQWVRFSLEFLNHLCADWEMIKSVFSPHGHPGVISSIQGGAGDTHRDGRSVMIVKFSSGFQIVYKPHSLAIDVHFNELLSWLNKRGDHPPLRTLRVLDRGTHGWVEFIERNSCQSEDEVHRFYERQGAYLALFYALEATDFHFENLLAAGEHPIPVDLESLFHPREPEGENKQSDTLAFKAIGHSVLRVGLLPQLIWGNADYEGIDLSGLGAPGGQLTPDRLPQIEGGFTDEMRIIRKRLEMPPGRNRPALNGAEVNALDYAEDIYTGFQKMYRLLMYNTDDLVSKEGFLARFVDDEIRMIPRATRLYSILLNESFHPDFLRDALERDQLFDRLWLEIENRSVVAKLIPSEFQDLHRSEVPFFSTRPGSKDIYSSSGERVADFYEKTGFDLVEDRLLNLREDDLNKQLWYIKASLATLAMSIVSGSPANLPKKIAGAQKPTHLFAEPSVIPSPEQLSGLLLAGASVVGDRLESLALCGEGDASWLGLSVVGEGRWFLSPMGFDLYSGLPGVSLFLAYLGWVTGEEKYAVLVKAALTTMRRQIEPRKKMISALGAFDGWGGVIYTLTHLSALWHEPDLLNEADEYVDLIPDFVKHDETLDIIGGSAGCIGCLIAFNRVSPSGKAINAAVQCGDHLIARSKPMKQGIGWPSKMARENEALSGFSHGTAGIAWALLELAAVTGEERFRKAALEAMAYERSLFSAEKGNWPDLRIDEKNPPPIDSPPSFMWTWCHGAPGIGLARLSSLRHLDGPEIRNEINLALKSNLENGFGKSHSLCHGDLGNIETLLYASETFDPVWRREVNKKAAAILDSIEQNGWQCGVPLGTETPGLMVGLAGIGYELLRLAEPRKVPSVLILEPPYMNR